MFIQTYEEAMARKANRASHGPRVLAKDRARKERETENPKENPKVPKVRKVRTRVYSRKLVYLVLKTPNQRQVQKLRNLHRRTTYGQFLVR